MSYDTKIAAEVAKIKTQIDSASPTAEEYINLHRGLIETIALYNLSISSGGGGGGSTSDASAANQTAGNTSLGSIDSNLGAKSDFVAASDTGTFSVTALIKRGLQNWTTFLARMPALVSGRIPIDATGTVTANAGTDLNTSLLARESGGNLAASVTALNNILAELRDDVFITSTLWEDRSAVVAVFYREERVRSQDDGTTTTLYTRLSDNTIVGSMPSGVIPVAGATDRMVEYFRWKSANAGTGYAVGNWIVNTLITDTDGAGAIVSSTWYNLNTGLAIATAPLGADLADPNDQLLAVFGAQGDAVQINPATPATLIGYTKGLLTNWSSFLARIPASLGTKLSAGSFSATIASDDPQFGNKSTAATLPTGGLGLLGWVSDTYRVLLGSLTPATGLFTRLTDGANTATVKAASTSPALADPALVVSLSGNSANMGGLVPNATATRSSPVSGMFNTALPTLTTGQMVPLQLTGTSELVAAPYMAGSPIAGNAGAVNAQTQRVVQAQLTVTQVGQVNPTADTALPAGARVRGLLFTNTSAIPVFVGVYVSGAALTAASVPNTGYVIRVPAGATLDKGVADFGEAGRSFGANTRIGLSSTMATFTALTAPNLLLCSLNLEVV
jgi:hypothetical protein